ncbi:hypothetical protein [Nocardiopsis protaetiae]|uniref:hypothetical protein n=1 Tax=Nocardiopsis protaetiae TaxID=3382270 RepID=UPI00387A8F80
METDLPEPEPEPGQILVRNTWMSVDARPYIRDRMDDVPSYTPPFEISAVPWTGAPSARSSPRAPGDPGGSDRLPLPGLAGALPGRLRSGRGPGHRAHPGPAPEPIPGRHQGGHPARHARGRPPRPLPRVPRQGRAVAARRHPARPRDHPRRPRRPPGDPGGPARGPGLLESRSPEFPGSQVPGVLLSGTNTGKMLVRL